MVFIGKSKNYLEYVNIQIGELDINEDYKYHIRNAWYPVLSELI